MWLLPSLALASEPPPRWDWRQPHAYRIEAIATPPLPIALVGAQGREVQATMVQVEATLRCAAEGPPHKGKTPVACAVEALVLHTAPDAPDLRADIEGRWIGVALRLDIAETGELRAARVELPDPEGASRAQVRAQDALITRWLAAPLDLGLPPDAEALATGWESRPHAVFDQLRLRHHLVGQKAGVLQIESLRRGGAASLLREASFDTGVGALISSEVEYVETWTTTTEALPNRLVATAQRVEGG